MSTHGQTSSETESGRGVSPRFQWRVRHSAVVCVIAILVLLFSVQRAFIFGPSASAPSEESEALSNPPPSWLRDTQVEEKGDHYLVRMSIPGIDQDELEVELDSGVLRVTGRRGISQKDEGSGWIRRSEMRSSFQKTCAFPGEVEPEIAETKIEDGVLLVKVPKARSL